MATVLFTPKNLISKTDKAKLIKEGYLVIEADDPNSIKTIADISHIETNEIVESALKCVAHKDMPWNLKSWLSDVIANTALTKISNSKKQLS